MLGVQNSDQVAATSLGMNRTPRWRLLDAAFVCPPGASRSLLTALRTMPLMPRITVTDLCRNFEKTA